MIYIRNIFCCICLFCFSLQLWGQQPFSDSTVSDSIQIDSVDHKVAGSKNSTIHQLRVGFDVGRILFNNLFPSRKGYGVKADYNWNETLYFAAEAGWGRGKVDYSFLKYKTNGNFIKIGINKTLLGRLGPTDFDNAFIGLRYGLGFGKRGDAHYTVPSPFGGASNGIAKGKSYFVHWGEIVAGLSVSIWGNLYAGWMIRGKFLINPGHFKSLSPNYIPGFGKGDKKSVFDFNIYLSYGIPWH